MAKSKNFSEELKNSLSENNKVPINDTLTIESRKK